MSERERERERERDQLGLWAVAGRSKEGREEGREEGRRGGEGRRRVWFRVNKRKVPVRMLTYATEERGREGKAVKEGPRENARTYTGSEGGRGRLQHIEETREHRATRTPTRSFSLGFKV